MPKAMIKTERIVSASGDIHIYKDQRCKKAAEYRNE